MKKIFVNLIFILCIFSTHIFGADTRFHRELNDGELEMVFSELGFVEDDLKKFIRSGKSCDFNILNFFNKIEKNKIHIPILMASKLNLIDDIETEILMDLIQTYKKIARPKSEFSISIKSGNQLIDNFYKKVFKQRSCISDFFDSFKAKISIIDTKDMESSDLLKELTIKAYKKRQINENEYRLLMTLIIKKSESRMSIREYKNKREGFKKYFNINPELTNFHVQTHTKGEHSLRYNIYKNLSSFEVNELNSLIKNLVSRVQASKGEIILVQENGEVVEKKIMSQMEQFHYGLKLYSIEKEKVKKRLGDKSSFVNFRNLLATAFELSSINKEELEGLFMLEQKVKEESLFEQGFGYAKQYGFIVSSLTIPLVGTVYGLSLGLIEQYFFPPEKQEKKNYDHDLFYGNCEMNL